MSTKPIMTEGMFTSRSEDWGTPQYVFNKLHKEFNFILDVCASKENAKCEHFISKEQNAFNYHWADDAQALFNEFKHEKGAIWMNPPYGKTIEMWMRKAYQESQRGIFEVVCLVHSRTDTKWWHNWAMKAEEIRFVKGRLRFGDGKQSAPFPSCVVVFRPVLFGNNIYNTPKISTITF